MNLLLLFACGPEPEPPAPVRLPAEVVSLDGPHALERASMVLRGVRPSVADLQAVQADPAAYDRLVQEWLYDPRFGDTMRDLHNDAWSMRATAQVNLPASGALADVEMARLRRSLYESPLRTIEKVIVDDLPYTTILTADWQMADDVVARAWQHVDGYDPAAGGWQQVYWTDDRPAAGILSDNMMFVRFASMGSNYNRGRANHISRALLCHDYLDREITLDSSVDLSDPDVVAEAVTASEACATCHRTLDPLASFIPYRDGFALMDQVWPTEMYISDWAAQESWLETTEREPAYYGKPGRTMEDLARFIRDDPRFSLCTARRFYAYFTQVPLEHVPEDAAAELQDVLVGSGWDARALSLAVVRHPDFLVASVDDAERAEDLVGLQQARPEQLARMFEDLTGFVWQTYQEEECCVANAGTSPIGLVEVPTDAWSGFQTLLGGIDGAFVSQPSHTSNATSTLALRRFAAEAAGWVVPRDLAAPPAERKLLGLVEADTTDEAAIRAQFVALHARLYGDLVRDDDPSVDAAWTLWSAVHASSSDPARAWQATLTAMLQDWRILYY